MTALMLIRPSPIVTGTIRTNVRFTAGSWMSIDGVQLAVAPAQPGQRQQELDDGRDEDRDGVEVEPRALEARVLAPSARPSRITRFHATGLNAGTVKWS